MDYRATKFIVQNANALNWFQWKRYNNPSSETSMKIYYQKIKIQFSMLRKPTS